LTGGDSGIALAGLAKMFYNPTDFGVLPYKHNYTQSGEYVYTGFFIPAHSMHSDSCDKRGVCNEIDAKIHYNNERLKKSNDLQNLMEFKSEFCFYPEEALIREGENRFDAIKLAEQIANIDLHKVIEAPKNVSLTWKYTPELGTIDRSKMPELEYTKTGKILMLEQPMTDDNEIPYSNLYVGGIDSIDSDSTSSTGQKDVSEFAIVIYKRQLGLQEPKIVAIYKDRPKDIREAYDNAIKLLMFYNAKAVVEMTRTSIITYFKEHNKLFYLMHRPKATMSDVRNGNSKAFGTPATVPIINHYLDLIDNYINDYWYSINFIDVLNELCKYSFENKRKFDLVAALGMALLADEELMGLLPKSTAKVNKEWQDVGYYYVNGYRKFGVIPNKNELNNTLKNNYDWIRN